MALLTMHDNPLAGQSDAFSVILRQNLSLMRVYLEKHTFV